MEGVVEAVEAVLRDLTKSESTERIRVLQSVLDLLDKAADERARSVTSALTGEVCEANMRERCSDNFLGMARKLAKEVQ